MGGPFQREVFFIIQLASVEESVFKYFSETRRHTLQMRHLGNRCVASVFHSQKLYFSISGNTEL